MWKTVNLVTKEQESRAAKYLASDSDILLIQGPCHLSGQHHIQGFKHLFVTLASLACTSNQQFDLHNCPNIQETRSFVNIIQKLGGYAHFSGGKFTIDGSSIHRCLEAGELNAEIHGAVYLIPAMLKRTQRAVMNHGGGCQIGDTSNGARPIEHYIEIFERFGASTQVMESGEIHIQAERLQGCKVDLLEYTHCRENPTGPKWSGASKMALLMAVISEGVSEIYHLYPKPDVMEMLVVMEKMGVKVEYLAQDSVRITPKQDLNTSITRVDHTLIPDLIEIVTWICAGALYASPSITLKARRLSCALLALEPELQLFKRIGVSVIVTSGTLTVEKVNNFQPFDTHVCSKGIFSDSQPFFALLATYASGNSKLVEEVWKNRFDYAKGLALLGCGVEVSDNQLLIYGEQPPKNTDCLIWGSDLRAAAVLLIAALGVSGRTELRGAHHLERGYSALPKSLNQCGAHITSGDMVCDEV
ncbi:hypothetical protein [Pseudoalteromonas sp. S16_S37]|uniref:hypothetical protein n=1 Tax=Pseudoalteromonas sp. S16_S37 TaxID=2720228 RepID=UPI00168194DC|nr:hypothetical protein [Pseudoalteromonas sp. S16_S37]MBD1583319.1 hypothetical protein [Pseudoalteromonas sp. S16_S37]